MTWLTVITEGKLEGTGNRKSRQAILIPQSWFSRDSGQTYYYDSPYYPMLQFPGSERTNFNNQARVPNGRQTASSSLMYPTCDRIFCGDLFHLHLA